MAHCICSGQFSKSGTKVSAHSCPGRKPPFLAVNTVKCMPCAPIQKRHYRKPIYIGKYCKVA